MRRRISLAAGVGLGLGLLVLLASGLSAVFFVELVELAMTPRRAFSAAAVPRAPDYAGAAAWSALPPASPGATAAIAATAALPELPATDPGATAADVFYVHPTSYIGGSWNGPVDDPRLNRATDLVATRIQASAFNSCCAVYAPRYRQASGTAFTHPSPSGQAAIELAYGDVRAAFQFFLATYSRGRPFILAAHSQGSFLLRRLLVEEVSGRPLRDRLIAAYVIGIPLDRQALASEAPELPVCATPTQTGCVISWNARGPGFKPGRLEFPAMREAAELRVCVNPLSFRDDEVPVAAAQNEGAVFLEHEPPLRLPRFASAACQRGTLVVSELGQPPRDLLSRLLDHALGPGNYHPIEYQLYFVNLRHNAEARVAAYRSQHPAAAP